ncbi:GntR family transcriptional regulator [Nocardioides humi]|uniref:GntR family transcriptional regulator n=1 Tax=Nocardioides humi TaxID=449461 RepID=A0ABN2AY29_9ACTN|nr:GntR family transcriptional regulator [Nocardioides humi]
MALPTARRLLVRRLRDLLRVTLADAAHDVRPERRLGGEAELMSEFAAPRDAVREALSLLADEGLVSRRRGLGTFCTDESFDINVQLPAHGTPMATQFGGRDRLTIRLLEWSWLPAPSAVAQRLDGVGDGDDCLCIDYVLLRNDTPACVITNYLRRQEAASLTPADFVDDFYAMLSGTGSTIASEDIVLQPRLADPEVADLLGIAAGDPVMWMDQVIRDDRGQAIDFAIVHMHGELRVGIPGVPRMTLRGFGSVPGLPR